MLHHLGEWMGPKGLLAAATEDIEAFLDSRRIGRKSRYNYISNLHSFYQWAVTVGEIESDPTAQIVRPKLRPGLPRPIADSDLSLALDMARGDIGAMLCCAAYQGMRCIEIARLTREDVLDERTPPVILARGKGDKPRIIPMHPKTWEALRMLPLPRSGPVFRWSDGRALPAWKVSALGNEYLHGVGLDATMHQLRHWFGTTVYRTSGRDLLLVRDLMGHSSITTTTIYAAFDRAGAQEAITALGPSGPGGWAPKVSGTALRGAPGTGTHIPATGSATEGSRHSTL
jgi:integrase/recombinase XerC